MVNHFKQKMTMYDKYDSVKWVFFCDNEWLLIMSHRYNIRTRMIYKDKNDDPSQV
jgi:hypothetical protein